MSATEEKGDPMPPEECKVVVSCTSVTNTVSKELTTKSVGTFVMVRNSPFEKGSITVL